MRFTFLICFFSALVFVKAFATNPSKISESLSLKDSTSELREFKTYLKAFVRAVEANDTSFIKNHTIFPIANSSVSSRKLDQRYFIKHLADFFPKDLLKRIEREGKIVISKPTKGEKDFIVTIYDTTQGTDANYSWIFTRKQSSFYFVTFRTEVG